MTREWWVGAARVHGEHDACGGRGLRVCQGLLQRKDAGDPSSESWATLYRSTPTERRRSSVLDPQRSCTPSSFSSLFPCFSVSSLCLSVSLSTSQARADARQEPGKALGTPSELVRGLPDAIPVAEAACAVCLPIEFNEYLYQVWLRRLPSDFAVRGWARRRGASPSIWSTWPTASSSRCTPATPARPLRGMRDEGCKQTQACAMRDASKQRHAR
jgi:hypothetical protein